MRQRFRLNICVLTVVSFVIPEKYPVSFEPHLAEIASRVKAAGRRKRSVIIGQRKRSGVGGIPHRARPVKGTHRIARRWSNPARITGSLVGDVQRQLGWYKLDRRNAGYGLRRRRKAECVHNRHIDQMNGHGVAINFYSTRVNLHGPKETVRQRPRAEIMQLGPQTEVPEVQSYFDKDAIGLLRHRGSRRINGVRGCASDEFALVDADVGDDSILIVLVISRQPAGVAHRRQTLEVGDHLRVGADRIKGRSLARRTGNESVSNSVSWDQVATANRNWLDR